MGVSPSQAIVSLETFQNVKRRMEVRAVINDITLYDDFAHHPTAIASTLAGLRGKVGKQRIIAVLEPRSNTMKMGVHKTSLLPSLIDADRALIYLPDELDWDMNIAAYANIQTFKSIDELVNVITSEAEANNHVLFMSNGGFSGIHQKVEDLLRR